jgi:hypothetical protein
LIATAAGTLYAFAEPQPVIHTPANRTIRAPSGARTVRVTYQASAKVDATPIPVSCHPASGSRFKLGKTTVVCTATSNGQTTTRAFTIMIKQHRPTRRTNKVLPHTALRRRSGRG